MKRHIFIFQAFLILGVFILAGCSLANPTPAAIAPTALPAAQMPATPTALPSSEEKPELGVYFQGQMGAFVLYDLNHDHFIRYNPAGCAERLLPASTYKIMNSLVGLETGVIPDENYVIKWDGTHYDIPAWNQDHTMKSAIQNSVVWYYQELARRVGSQKMQQYVDAVGYGNQDISGRIDSFWLDGGLRISADEQVGFLKRLYLNDLPFSQRTMTIVKNIIVLEKTDAYQLSGKTGSVGRVTPYVGWFVGYLETGGDVYFFATHLQSSDPNGIANGDTARKINWQILQALNLVK